MTRNQEGLQRLLVKLEEAAKAEANVKEFIRESIAIVLCLQDRIKV